MGNIPQQFEPFLSAEVLIVPCRNFVYPEYQLVMYSLGHDATTVLDLLKALGKQDRVNEIYDRSNRGLFVGQLYGQPPYLGMQVLTELVGKPIEFWYQPFSEPILDHLIARCEPTKSK